MKKPLIAIAVIAVLVGGFLLVRSGEGDDTYRVRAVFDTGAFVTPGGEVRAAGATIGSIESVGVTGADELASYRDGEFEPAPAKAVLVLKIDDEGFADFRRDASCVIRPQSLIGEKFVDCRPTQPRAPGSQPPPPLREIPDGEPGAGQHLLPLERNSASVDPDLINNIQRLPYAQRFRLVLNELGATFAGRGEDLQEIVKRANPVLRDVTTLIRSLDEQRDELTQLAVDGERILEPLARERTSVAGFFSNSGAAAQATTERGAELEASLEKLPSFLREFRDTLAALQGFAEAGTPVARDFDRATPALTRATRLLTPFSAASTVSLRSLGATGVVAGPKFKRADPVVKLARNLAKSGARPTSELAKFLGSTRDTGGFDGLADLIYNSAGASNEYDQNGHFLRSLAAISTCFVFAVRDESGCNASFIGGSAITSVDQTLALLEIIAELERESGGGTEAGEIAPPAPPAISGAEESPAPELPDLGDGEELEEEQAGPAAEEDEAQASSSRLHRALHDYLRGR